MKLSTQPYKGARDFYPEDMRPRNYIFDTWKRVCKSYGYEEYDGPLLESFDIYAAKSGEELVNEQLYSFEDRGSRKIAIRPEKTPTLARMVAAKYKTLPLPIRWFNIGNCWRYEKPQKGRLREFYQLDVDTFGTSGPKTDFEVLSVAIDIMKSFGASDKTFEIRIGNRRLLEDILGEIKIPKEKTLGIIKVIDRKAKVSEKDFMEMLAELKLTAEQIDNLNSFLLKPEPWIKKVTGKSKGAQEVLGVLELAKKSGKDTLIKYDPTITRGLDYYTGNVFEMFNLDPDNKRAIMGGGRYDDLVESFTGEKLSGMGWAMGDVTMLEFLKTWNLLPKFDTETEFFVVSKGQNTIADKLRQRGKNVSEWLESDSKLDKALKYADKKSIPVAIIVGEKESKENTVTIKDMRTGQQTTKPLEEFLSELS